MTSTGLYPPKDRWIWDNSSLIGRLWQPIPVYSGIDSMARENASCPNSDLAINKTLENNVKFKQYWNSIQPIVAEINNYTGRTYTDLQLIAFLHTTLLDIEKLYYPLPSWVTPRIAKALDEMQDKWYYYYFISPTAQRLRAGPVLKELITNINKTLNNVSDTKFVYYNAHGRSLGFMLLAFGLNGEDNIIVPSMGTSLIFELHTIRGQNVIKLFMAQNDEGVYDKITVREMKIEKCSANNMCTVNEFIKLVLHLIPINWQQECGLV